VHQQHARALLHETIGFLMRQMYVRFTAAAVHDDPMSRDLVVLDTLADQDAASQQDLAERLGINRAIMVRVIDRLEHVGHVRRMRNPGNRRVYVLSLTEAGRAARGTMRDAVSDRAARVTAALTERERQRLNELLSKLLPEPDLPSIRSTEYLVSHAHFWMRRVADGLLRASQLRTRHIGALAAIDTLGPCTQQQLAQKLAIAEPATTQIVDELYQAGLVTRGQDARDRRRYALELTELGRQRLADVYQAVVQVEAEVRDRLGGESAAEELRALLIKTARSAKPDVGPVEPLVQGVVQSVDVAPE